VARGVGRPPRCAHRQGMQGGRCLGSGSNDSRSHPVGPQRREIGVSSGRSSLGKGQRRAGSLWLRTGSNSAAGSEQELQAPGARGGKGQAMESSRQAPVRLDRLLSERACPQRYPLLHFTCTQTGEPHAQTGMHVTCTHCCPEFPRKQWPTEQSCVDQTHVSPASLAIPLMERMLHSMAFTQWTPEGMLSGAAGALVAYCAVELAIRPMAVKTPSSPRAPRWDLFAVFNVAACLAGASAGANLFKYLPTATEEARIDFRAIVAIITLALCTTYAIAFCGVSLVWRAIDDGAPAPPRAAKTSPANAKRMAVARKQRLKDDNMDADVIIVGAGTAGAALAAVLGRQGKHVLLLERSDEIPVSSRLLLRASPVSFPCNIYRWPQGSRLCGLPGSERKRSLLLS
jgi:hypothetical protein